MLDAVVMPAKPLATALKGAHMILLSRVYPIMPGQMATRGEPAGTNLANVPTSLLNGNVCSGRLGYFFRNLFRF